ncbi:MAG: glycoside hydrolase family 3 N-terminal domain-containing protein [Microbacterium sp.]
MTGRTGARLVGVACLAGLGVIASVSAPASGQAASDAPAAVEPAGDADVRERAAEIVGSLDVRERAGVVVMGYAAGTDGEALRGYLADSGIGGLILMGDNVPEDAESLAAMTATIAGDAALSFDGEAPPLIAIDQEGGVVSRIGWDAFESAGALAQEDPDRTERAFAGRGALLARDGVSLNFGIVADETDDASSFIASRVLGTSPDAAAARVEAAVAGEAPFALTTLKHFPGHGEVSADSHQGIPTTPQAFEDWGRTNAVPFRAGIEAGTDLVMMGHLAYTDVDAAPASLSPAWYRVLRDDMGFSGVAVTDDLGMLLSSGQAEYADPVGNAVSALGAGADLLLTIVGSDRGTAAGIVDGVAAAVEDGTVPEERLTEAAERVVALRLESGAATALSPAD